MGSDGVNPIYFQILVGHGNRMWLEAHYFDPSIKPIGKLKVIIPEQPDTSEEDPLLDAVLALAPACFGNRRPSLAVVAAELKDAERLDFDAAPGEVPAEWHALREEARPPLREIGIRRAGLTPMSSSGSSRATQALLHPTAAHLEPPQGLWWKHRTDPVQPGLEREQIQLPQGNSST